MTAPNLATARIGWLAKVLKSDVLPMQTFDNLADLTDAFRSRLCALRFEPEATPDEIRAVFRSVAAERKRKGEPRLVVPRARVAPPADHERAQSLSHAEARTVLESLTAQFPNLGTALRTLPSGPTPAEHEARVRAQADEFRRAPVGRSTPRVRPMSEAEAVAHRAKVRAQAAEMSGRRRILDFFRKWGTRVG